MAIDTLPLDFGRDKPFYVYLYRDPRPRKGHRPIYVGKGTAEWQRADAHWRRGSHNRFLTSILDKIRRAGLEPEIEIIGWFDDEVAALKCERDLIKKIGRRNLGEGPLTNLKDGAIETSRWVYPEELRQQKRELMNARYADPAEREKTGQYSREAWQRPEYREKVIAAATKGMQTAEYRAATSSRVKAQWRDPAFRAMQVANLVEINSRPDVKASKAAKMAERWRDPEERARRQDGIRRHHSTPEYRAAKSADTASKWADPEHRKMRIARISAARRKWLWELGGVVYESPEDAGQALGITAGAVRWRIQHGHGRKVPRVQPKEPASG